ncbi:CheR family methyltransferase [Sneathiella sp. HT1-7]|jgi:chemotaxis protein methyltransferase CheR|uniref:CheR family methyltransferase n=1 Tax=Sneathiella sp. HT1-7 TaxID=2887192 RepID=UPI001D15A9C6|nr:protein-glutamate O-methyltransferase [Sneathiella sp. HT1-7]MCC3306548.1 protein-glutamate O-methyltransferase [Sneathiella sp. HT1-7]
MNSQDFQLFGEIVNSRSGLVLTEEKIYLLESRLVPLARRRGLENLEALAEEVRRYKDDRLLEEITEAMTTNETFFFRDTKPFDTFRDVVLPQLLKARATKKTLRIWTAACSTGQEPYSIAMLLKEEAAKMAGWRVEIMATDISQEVLEKAKAGLYSQFEVQRGLPIQLLMKHFQQVGEMWQIDSSIRAMVKFQPKNLLEDLGSLGQFDVVFCRNVLIYFDQPTKSKVLTQVHKILADDGALFLGGAETVLGICDSFKPVDGQRGVYTSVNGGLMAAAS